MNPSLLSDIFKLLDERYTPPFDLDRLAADIGYSKYYLCRAFHAATGEGLVTYLRRLTLAKSAHCLRAGERVLEVAIAHGYQSQEAYHRAFQKMFHTTPAAFQRGETHPSMLIKRSWSAELMPRKLPETHAVDWPETSVWGMGGEYSYDEFDEIFSLWQRFHQTVSTAFDTFGVTSGIDGQPDRFRYFAASDRPHDSIGLKSITLPARRYQLFIHHGPASTLMQTFNYIWGVWLPEQGYRVEGVDFERYPAGYDPEAHDGVVEIYLPLAS